MSTQQECPGCLGNGKLSWQKPAVIQLCYESEVFGDCTNGSINTLGECDLGPSAQLCGGGSTAFSGPI